MSPTQLTPQQRRAIDAIVQQRRLAAVPPDLERARLFVTQAREAIDDLPNLTRSQNRYVLAYDACHDLGEALLAAYGFRTLGGTGQHDAVGRFLRAVLDNPPGQMEAGHFDRLRRSRNQLRYAARPIGESEAELATRTALGLLSALKDRGIAP